MRTIFKIRLAIFCVCLLISAINYMTGNAERNVVSDTGGGSTSRMAKSALSTFAPSDSSGSDEAPPLGKDSTLNGQVPGTWAVKDSSETLTVNPDGSFQRTLTFGGMQTTSGGLKFSHQTTCYAEGVWWVESGSLFLQVKKVGGIKTRDMKVHPPQAGEPAVKIPSVEELRALLPKEIGKQIQTAVSKQQFGGQVTDISSYRLTLTSGRQSVEYTRVN